MEQQQNQQHPIQGLMYTSMQSIKEMIDVNTIVGDAVETGDGTVIIPISKVGVGFAVGGSDYKPFRVDKKCDSGSASMDSASDTMFGGGTGAGVSLTPVAFMVVGCGQIRLIPVNPEANTYDKLLDFIPEAIDRVTASVKKLRKDKNKDAETESGDESVSF